MSSKSTESRTPQNQSWYCYQQSSSSDCCLRCKGGEVHERALPTPTLQPGISSPPHACLPSTQAGLALVVPAIWPFLQAQRAVCLAMVRRGWLLSLSSVTISHVPAASWPGNDIAPQEAGSEGRHRKQQKTESACQRVPITVQGFGSDGGHLVVKLGTLFWCSV